MTKRKPKATLPPLVVVIRQEQPSAAQAQSWTRLFDRLLAPRNEDAAAPGGDDLPDMERSEND